MTEIPPVGLRGAVGLCHQLGITGAILLSQILGVSYVSLSSPIMKYDRLLVKPTQVSLFKSNCQLEFLFVLA